jgi:mannosyl-oligosaccharide alpha-1,2-mannosidase
VVGSAKHIAQLPAPLPGLAAQSIYPVTGDFIDSYITWGGGSDSYFEYLIKYARLTNTDDETFVYTWKTAVESTIKNLLFVRPAHFYLLEWLLIRLSIVQRSTVGNWLYAADRTNAGKIAYIYSHLACFQGGNWILGGRLIGDEEIVKYGLELADTCYNTYASSPTGIGPEVFAYMGPNGNYTGANITAEDIAFYGQHGWYVYTGNSHYYL